MQTLAASCATIHTSVLLSITLLIVIAVLLWNYDRRQKIITYTRERVTPSGRRYRRDMEQWQEQERRQEAERAAQAERADNRQQRDTSPWDSRGFYLAPDDDPPYPPDVRDQKRHDWMVWIFKLTGLILAVWVLLILLFSWEEVCMSTQEVEHPPHFQTMYVQYGH